MKLDRCILASLLLVSLITPSWAVVTVNGSRVEDTFSYAAGPLNGQSGGGEVNLLGTWSSLGDATPGDPFIVKAQDIQFGPQVALFDGLTAGSIGRTPQAGVGGASRLIGNGTNTNIQSNLTANFKESFTQMKMVWNGGKVGFALASEAFDLSNFNTRLLSNAAGLRTGWGFSIEADTGNPDIGYLMPTVFEAYTNGTSANFTGTGIQLNKGQTYQVFVRSELASSNLFGPLLDQQDQISVYVLSEADVANPETTVYLADLPSTSQSSLPKSIFNFNVKDNLQFALYATQNFEVDDLKIGWLTGTDASNFVDCATCDTARQALVAFRTDYQKIAWKSSLGDPYLPGDTNLNGVVLGSATNTDPNSNDINHLAAQVRLGNTSTVAYYDLDSSGVIDYNDVVYLVETIYGSHMGDFDLDKDVDNADLAIWSAGYGLGGGWSQGDANGDGLVNGADYLVWQKNYTGPGVLTAGTSAIPEPATGALLLLALVGPLSIRRRAG